MSKKMLVSISDQLARRIHSMIPSGQRSAVITSLLEKELERRERLLYECALEVEQDEALHKEMAEWEVTVKDGLHDESW